MSIIASKQKIAKQKMVTSYSDVPTTFEEVCAREMAIHDHLVMEQAKAMSRPKETMKKRKTTK